MAPSTPPPDGDDYVACLAQLPRLPGHSPFRGQLAQLQLCQPAHKPLASFSSQASRKLRQAAEKWDHAAVAPAAPQSAEKSQAQSQSQSQSQSPSLPKDFKNKTVEEQRMAQEAAKERYWRRWGPYLSERQWGTVREDYSQDGNAWAYFPHDHARSRAFRWGEDGIAGVSDNHARLGLSLALWNGKDPILKERMFGLTNQEGNHGEDVKELYWYLDNVPSHSYMKYLYKYPQSAFPYQQLVEENARRSKLEQEFELPDTGIFNDNKYWDVLIEYAKDDDDENAVSMRITVINRADEAADLHIIPQAFFRNTWAWDAQEPDDKPTMHLAAPQTVQLDHPTLGRYFLYAHSSASSTGDSKNPVEPTLLFTENDTNFSRLYGGTNKHTYAKDAFHDHLIPSHRPADAPQDAQYVNPDKKGTKVGAHYFFSQVPSQGKVVVRLKLTPRTVEQDEAVDDDSVFDSIISARQKDADEFYVRLGSKGLGQDQSRVFRQLLAGMLWTKQFYYYVELEWSQGDPGQPAPPPRRAQGRNTSWTNLYMQDILSVPDKWEYPYPAVWDLAFHTVPLALVDPAFAKSQLDVYTREWYMKPDGALPAYEWNYDDVNPPVHAWAVLRVYQIESKMYGVQDLDFLERVFQKMILYWGFWVNRKDANGMNIFEGGFLGLDNIGPFNRSEPLPGGKTLRQSDGTAWMAFFALTMLSMALELARHNPNYEDIASKFFEHFIVISDAMTHPGYDNQGLTLWDEEDGFYYDTVELGRNEQGIESSRIPVRSLVGLIPLFSVLTIEPGTLQQFPGFNKRFQWLVDNRPGLTQRNMANMRIPGSDDLRLLALVSRDRLERILRRVFDETEFFSDHGVRSLSKYHLHHPWSITIENQTYGVQYWPADSHSGMFGGNSNWRGPIWIATNFLLIESLFKLYQYYGDSFHVEVPTGSGKWVTLDKAAIELERRLTSLFAKNGETGRRPLNGANDLLDFDPHFSELLSVPEYFDGDNGRGLGASHQTGWTGLIAYSIIHRVLGLHGPPESLVDQQKD